MSVVAVSESIGSLGIEMGRLLAGSLGYEFAERDIIGKAADRFGEDVARLSHAAEERPSLVERFAAAQRRFALYVEATVHEMAAHDDIVLVGLSSTLILREAPHTLRLRVTAPERRRAQRVAQGQGLGEAAALDHVRDSDRERSGRVRFLYHVDWEDPLQYDFVVNTDRLTAEEAAEFVRKLLSRGRFESSEPSRRAMKDLSLAAQARALLIADPITRHRAITVECANGVLALGGRVEEWSVRNAAERALARVPGCREVRFLAPGAIEGEGAEDSGLYGASRRWGGYGPR
jgi:cytidylate kinase